MLDRRDFLMNMIEKMSESLGKYILGLTQQKKHDLAIQYLEDQLTKLGVPNSRMLRSVDNDTLLSLLSSRGEPDGDKMLLVALLLAEEAHVIEDRLKDRQLGTDTAPEEDELIGLRIKVLFLLLSAHEEGYQAQSFDLELKVREVVDLLSSYFIPVSISRKLFAYYESSGQYALAEDQLYELKRHVELDEGEQFYGRLLQRSEEELVQGNFSLEEVEDGLRDWRKAQSESQSESQSQ